MNRTTVESKLQLLHDRTRRVCDVVHRLTSPHRHQYVVATRHLYRKAAQRPCPVRKLYNVVDLSHQTEVCGVLTRPARRDEVNVFSFRIIRVDPRGEGGYRSSINMERGTRTNTDVV